MKILIIILLFTSCTHINKYYRKTDHEKFQNPYVILISIDGYRHDYTKIYNPPTLTKIWNEGLKAKSLIPVFPSKTFTNHYSIATGLYAENHGIVSNRFYDKVENQTYRLGDKAVTSLGKWYHGEPLWIAAEKQGMKTASFFWVGADVPIQGMYPSYYKDYDQTIPHQERVDQIIEWLKLSESERPHFITLYFSAVDSAGHRYGPLSKEVKKTILDVDFYINDLIQKAKKTKLPINYIIVSDHGMQEYDQNKLIYLNDYIPLDPRIKIVSKGTLMHLYINDSNLLKKTYMELKRHQKNKFKVYLRKNIPYKYHYRHHRVGDIFIEARAPFYILEKKSIGSNEFIAGSHGYDPIRTKTMHGIFYAFGPHIKERKNPITSFENIHIYPYIMNILGLDIKTKIDGKKRVLKPYLIDPKKEYEKEVKKQEMLRRKEEKLKRKKEKEEERKKKRR